MIKTCSKEENARIYGRRKEGENEEHRNMEEVQTPPLPIREGTDGRNRTGGEKCEEQTRCLHVDRAEPETDCNETENRVTYRFNIRTGGWIRTR